MSTFDRRYELIPRAELEQLQLERLQALLTRLRRNVRRSREKLADLRLDSLADLRRLPFTTQEDMVAASPMACLPSRRAKSSAWTLPSALKANRW
jgi:phenylacetate-coenzyme A ligase PaaK-like adenylate-forming protein